MRQGRKLMTNIGERVTLISVIAALLIGCGSDGATPNNEENTSFIQDTNESNGLDDSNITESNPVPIFKSQNSIQLQENSELAFTVLSEAVDGSSVTYAIIGGDDQHKITIDPQNGQLSFSDFWPDFDYPSDDDKNNIYEILIKVTDNQNYFNTQDFNITITDDENDLVPTKIVWKTGQDDGSIEGLPFGHERNFAAITENGERMIVAGNRMWEDSLHSINSTMNFDTAQGYCAGLNYGGHGDWRTPNRQELAEMINYGKTGIMFDDIFENKKAATYWTSQEKLSHTGNDSFAWSISFADTIWRTPNKNDAYNQEDFPDAWHRLEFIDSKRRYL
ncbi:MAG TPA: DUF1566 domain-containing protein [Epsilonproteobacteria bacterium]|nr:DUF1566 domain-containing protein [Campylobacterota bacterium]